MIFRQLFEKKSSTYTYLLADETTLDAILIDPVLDDIEQYVNLLVDFNLTLRYAVDTHVHADHITALGELRKRFGCKTMMGLESSAECVSENFSDQQVIRVGDLSLQVIYTPGHTDDSYSFYVPQLNSVFTGDTLLIRGTGRTDFQNGDSTQQYHSLFEKLLVLPPATRVFPAHDYKGWNESTIAEERRCNPRLQVKSSAEYSELMASLDLPNPAQMDIAVPANQRCGMI
jgi:glyoxylase-like metal-dependent hydrolase (beta-lactamase superfamily II)